MNCIIVDDEPLAQDLLEDFVQKVSSLNLVAKCKNAFEASEALKENEIDLMFLDIQMPEITGIQFLASLQKKPLVIFTTAYSNYAIEGFELSAVDYLLKPFSPERFLKAVSKAQELFDLKQSEGTQVPAEDEKDFIFVKSEYQTVKIVFDDILYVEGLKDYVKIHTKSDMIMTLMNLKAIQAKLPSSRFIRVHRSYIVSFKAINRIDRHRIIIGDKRIPVGDSYKEEFYKYVSI